MLPNLRTILVAMFLTAIVVTLVGTTLMPVPADIHSAGFPRVGQPLAPQTQADNPEWQQLHMLGYARRADELNRLLTLSSQLPAPMSGELPSAVPDAIDGGSSTFAKQGGNEVDRAPPSPTFALAPGQPARISDPQGDAGITGSVTGRSMPVGGAAANEVTAPAVDPQTKIVSAPAASNDSEAAQGSSAIAPITVLPPLARPKFGHALPRRRLHNR
jgi:hypothetical protein